MDGSGAAQGCVHHLPDTSQGRCCVVWVRVGALPGCAASARRETVAEEGRRSGVRWELKGPLLHAGSLFTRIETLLLSLQQQWASLCFICLLCTSSESKHQPLMLLGYSINCTLAGSVRPSTKREIMSLK